MPITIEHVRAAADRLRSLAQRTPVLTSRAIDDRAGASVFLKCENLQRVGAFKFRGAMNAVLLLSDDERARGVVTHSSGNHAQAIALAGRLAGVPACVVMPRTAPEVKRRATEGYGASVVSCEPTLADREATVSRLIEQHGYTLIHPFDDWRVIAGAGTAALELIEQAGPLDVLLAPVGGGGLMAGTCLAASGESPGTRLVGVEPSRADDARRSLESGTILPSDDPKTVADGLRTCLGARPFAVLRRHLERIVTADEAEILEAMRFVWERVNLIVEPSSAVPVAALLNGTVPEVAGKRVGVILTGGNVDLDPMFQALAERWLVPGAR
ncbi:pyridoxal-phosphate dependent enzyme [Tautonia sociabilis]|uniref:Pyridoxal-phosphate dependent enzyme n=1 Tax=Tautonia sociabilis TaxID=2080755 RepID=A0A432MN30_9BACT|nr:pyridoxal-phosphate dependent enzyme [Tautonia sociabilis]